MKVAVIGAGPAGMSCANALLSFGLEPIVIEKSDHVGGIQRANFHPNLWMLGMPGETGIGITERLAGHFFELPIATHLKADLRAIGRSGQDFELRLVAGSGETAITVQAVLLATGSRPRATPELRELAGRTNRVIIGALSETIRDGIRSSRVLILGGGDNALDHALYLAERGNRAVVCTRRGFSARKQFLEACGARAEIDLRGNCVPARLEGRADAVEATLGDRQERFDWLLVMYGYEPNTQVLECLAEDIRPTLTETGHIHVDRGQRTSVPGLYAAGDITDCVQPSVPTAIAQGLAAARTIERNLGQR